MQSSAAAFEFGTIVSVFTINYLQWGCGGLQAEDREHWKLRYSTHNLAVRRLNWCYSIFFLKLGNPMKRTKL